MAINLFVPSDNYFGFAVLEGNGADFDRPTSVPDYPNEGHVVLHGQGHLLRGRFRDR